MQLSQDEYDAIKDFVQRFRDYHDVANKVFAVTSGSKYISDGDFKKLRQDEKEKRDYLNEEFGVLETTIYNLMGGKPFMTYPRMPGRWDTFAEALSSNFTIIKGETLIQADDGLVRVLGVAKSLVNKKNTEEPIPPNKVTSSVWFSEELLVRITDIKIKALCLELNNVASSNPNASALLMRTILLLTLQKRIGKLARADLKDVLNQAISQDVYQDTHIKRILTHLSAIPKTMLDASHHSKWVIIKKDDIGIWLPGMVNVIEATFPEK